MVNRRFTRLIFAGLSVVVIMICFHSCMTFRMSREEIDEYFSARNIAASQHTYTVASKKIHYVVAGDESKPLVVFVHGSPGSLSAFIHFLSIDSLLNQALLISVDRPGFGQSNFGVAEPSLKKQSEMLKPMLEKYANNRPVILVGHSLGGPLIARMAVDFPQLVDGLILVAPSIDPELEPHETWFRAPLASPFLSWLLPRSLRASNEEIYPLKKELEVLRPLLSRIVCPVTVIQGESDSLVPFENAAFVKDHLTSTTPEINLVPGMDHFVPWSHPQLISSAIVNMLGSIQYDVELSGVHNATPK